MGMFSFVCSDTERALVCYDINMSKKENKAFCTKVAYCPIPEEFGGGYLSIDNNYDGYGVFYQGNGFGVDVYAALARWNVPEKCSGDDDKDRLIGIDLYYKNGFAKGEANTGIRYPLKITEEPIKYDYAEPCWDDENQGWGY